MEKKVESIPDGINVTIKKKCLKCIFIIVVIISFCVIMPYTMVGFGLTLFVRCLYVSQICLFASMKILMEHFHN